MNVGKTINVRLSFLNLKVDKAKRKGTQEVREGKKQRKEKRRLGEEQMKREEEIPKRRRRKGHL